MGAWIGLVGVVAGALVALVSQYIIRNSEARERRDALLLKQLAMVIALSEDYRDRIWRERNMIATGVVASWDIGSYRLAEAKLKILCQDSNLLATLVALNRRGGELGTSWSLSPEDESRTEAAWKAHKAALEQFIAAGSTMAFCCWIHRPATSITGRKPLFPPKASLAMTTPGAGVLM